MKKTLAALWCESWDNFVFTKTHSSLYWLLFILNTIVLQQSTSKEINQISTFTKTSKFRIPVWLNWIFISLVKCYTSAEISASNNIMHNLIKNSNSQQQPGFKTNPNQHVSCKEQGTTYSKKKRSNQYTTNTAQTTDDWLDILLTIWCPCFYLMMMIWWYLQLLWIINWLSFIFLHASRTTESVQR